MTLKPVIITAAILCLGLSYCGNGRVTKNYNGDFAAVKSGQISFPAQVISVTEDSVRVRNLSTGETTSLFGHVEEVNGASGVVTATATPDGLSLKSFSKDLDLIYYGTITSVEASDVGLYVTTSNHGRNTFSVSDNVKTGVFVGQKAFGNRTDGITLIKDAEK